MCTPDIPDTPPPPKPLIAPVARFDAAEIFGRRRIRGDPRSKSGFSAATFQTPKGVQERNPNKRRTLGDSIL